MDKMEDQDNSLDLRCLNEEEMINFALAHGLPKFRGKQIFLWVHHQGVSDSGAMSNLPLDVREMLQPYLQVPKVVAVKSSNKGDTYKFLLELADGARIETVLMIYHRKSSRERATCCVSTQTACAMGCKFCATGLTSNGRNLTVGEIISQVLAANTIAQDKGFNGVTNVVYMGMGEPLLNLDNVKKSILLLNDDHGLNIGMGKITVSTCGLIDGIEKVAAWGLKCGLAVSLHAPNDSLRTELMPINKRYPLRELLNACGHYQDVTGERITYEYALFKDVNDSAEIAHQLGKLLSGEFCLLNIIPANPVEETGFLPTKVEDCIKFMEILNSYNIDFQFREPRGIDIDAACGQLRRRNQAKE